MISTTLPQFPDTVLKVSLYTNVTNAEELRSKVADLSCALIDARTICSMEQLFAALHRTLMEVTYNRMRTKSLHSECLLCLSPSSNIGEAFKKFGVKDDSASIVCVQLGEAGLIQNEFIKGTEIEFNDANLSDLYDKNLLRKVCIPSKPYRNSNFILTIKILYQIYKFDASFQPQTTEELSRACINSIQLRGL